MACSREFKAVHSGGARFTSIIKWIGVHDEEALTARSAAAWFANPASGGSAHLCIDDKECYRTLEDNEIPWAASNSNTNGLHIEFAGYAAWKRWQWLKHKRMLDRGADRIAKWCVKYNIPGHFINEDDMHAGKKGLVTHATVSKYTAKYGLPGDHSHTDPGLFFPKRRLARKVRRRMKELRAH